MTDTELELITQRARAVLEGQALLDFERLLAVLRDKEITVLDARHRGHGEGQEHAIADVNAGLIDDLIAPRLQRERQRFSAPIEQEIADMKALPLCGATNDEQYWALQGRWRALEWVLMLMDKKETAMQQPSVGRIVLFRSEHSNGATEHPALINRVWSDTCVNLVVFPDCGVPMNKTSVVLNEDTTEGNQTYAWRWPPRVEQVK
jgi:hypothetical protein